MRNFYYCFFRTVVIYLLDIKNSFLEHSTTVDLNLKGRDFSLDSDRKNFSENLKSYNLGFPARLK